MGFAEIRRRMLQMLGRKERKLSYAGQATALSAHGSFVGAAVVGNTALIAGFNSSKANVDTYDASFVHGTATSLPTGRNYLAVGNIGNYALVAGGSTGTGVNTSVNTVDTYDTSLVHGTADTLQDKVRYLAKANIGGHVLLGGGAKYGGTALKVTGFDSNLTKNTSIAALANECDITEGAATQTSTHAFFTQMNGSSRAAYVAYDNNLVQSTTSEIPSATHSAAGGMGKCALFVGGTASSISNKTTMFDENLLMSTLDPLSVSRGNSTGISCDDECVMVVGGCTDTSTSSGAVDVYDKNYVHSTTTNLSVARGRMGGLFFNDHAMCISGSTGSLTTTSNVVELYKLS